jgi:hypothetical protein
VTDSTDRSGDPLNPQHPDEQWTGPQPPVQPFPGYQPQPHLTPTPQPTPTPTPQPAPKKKRTGLIVGIVSGSVFLLLLIAGAIGYVTLTAAHAPQEAVQSYLGALKSGNASEALRLTGVTPASTDLLLTDKAYRAATNRISRFTLESSAVDGDGAAVTANITQGAARYAQSFTLVKTGKDLLFFDVWQLRPVSLGHVVVRAAIPSDAALTVAGIPVKTSSSGIDLAALPGTYAVAAADTNAWYAINGSSAEVVGFGSAASKPAAVAATLTDQGKAAGTAAVNAYLDGCAASTEFRPAGCSFGATGEDSSYTYSNQKWTMDARPVFTIGQWVPGGWAVTTTEPGSATFTATISSGDGSGTAKAGPITVRVSGFITKIDDSGATFDSLTVEPATA